MMLFPKSIGGWIRSLAYSLFASCIIVWAVVFYFEADFQNQAWWFYAAPHIGRVLLPSLGAALAIICIFGTGLGWRFRIVALMVAVLSVLIGPALVFALAR